jgi:peptidoglycan/xylan/chitin deacetylase (PgdA/CDA1 family)
VTSLNARLRRHFLGTVTHVATHVPVVALTFDDGPDPTFTPRLLDILEKHGARATFFMVGDAAQRQPALVEDVAAAGHALGLHSWDHPSFPLITSRERRQQLRACAQALTPFASPIFRPPYGHLDHAARFDLWRMGYQVITWSGTISDWEAHPSEWFASRLSEQLRPGAIVLMHDALYHAENLALTDRQAVLAAIDQVLERIMGQYRFVTVPKLLTLGVPQRTDWLRRGQVDWLNRLQGAYGQPRHYARAAAAGQG